MKNLERETEFTKEITATNYTADSYNYDYSSYDSNYYNEPTDSSATSLTAGASATEGTGTSAPLQIEAAAGTIAAGHLASHTEHAPLDHANFSGEFPQSAEPSYSAGLEHTGDRAEKTVNS